MVGIGSLAELAVLREEQVVVIDPTIPLELICLAGCGVTTGLGAVFNVAEVVPDETVAVVGCGGVGLNVVQGARIAGATSIIALDPNPHAGCWPPGWARPIPSIPPATSWRPSTMSCLEESTWPSRRSGSPSWWLTRSPPPGPEVGA